MYDATFTGWWQWVVDVLLGLAMQKLSLAVGKNVTLAETVTYVQTKLATSICSTAEKYCVGPALQQYQNVTSCYNYLTTVTRFGEAYELGMYSVGFFPVELILTWVIGRDTLLCRMVHQNMVPLRPEVHCPHIGPSGGGYCVDTPSYMDTVGASYFSNFPFAYGNGSLSG